MKTTVQDTRQQLRVAIWRRARAWAKVYKSQADGPLLVRSMLLGIENGIRRRTGTLPEAERHCPQAAIPRAFWVGQDIAEKLPASILPHA